MAVQLLKGDDINSQLIFIKQLLFSQFYISPPCSEKIKLQCLKLPKFLLQPVHRLTLLRRRQMRNKASTFDANMNDIGKEKYLILLEITSSKLNWWWSDTALPQKNKNTQQTYLLNYHSLKNMYTLNLELEYLSSFILSTQRHVRDYISGLEFHTVILF